MVYQLIKYLQFRSKRDTQSRIAESMLKSRNSTKVRFSPVASNIKDILMTADVGTLRKHLNEGTFTSVDLVNFYGDRCQTIGRRLNLHTEEMFEEALA